MALHFERKRAKRTFELFSVDDHTFSLPERISPGLMQGLMRTKRLHGDDLAGDWLLEQVFGAEEYAIYCDVLADLTDEEIELVNDALKDYLDAQFKRMEAEAEARAKARG